MTNEDLRKQVELMWEAMRADGEMLTDAPAQKLGMPFAVAYEVIIPWDDAGIFSPVSINPESIPKLIEGLLKAQQSCIELTNEADAEYRAHEALQKAEGGANGG